MDGCPGIRVSGFRVLVDDFTINVTKPNSQYWPASTPNDGF